MSANNDGRTSRAVSGQRRPSRVEGMVDIPSKYSVEQTVERLNSILQRNGVSLFLLMDHSGEAKKAGMEMPPTKLLIFGSPIAGTPLMLAVPSVAIDLPLKILVWENGGGVVRVSYNSPDFLQRRHSLPLDLKKAVEVVVRFAEEAAR